MPVELAEVIARLRAELIEAMKAGADALLQFELGPVEVELTFSVHQEATAGAKVRFWVVDATTDGTLGSASQQRITLTLDPRVPDRPGTRPTISGAAEPDEQ